MLLYHRYYVLGQKNRKDYFLTEDKTYTNQLERAEKFSTRKSAQNMIDSYREIETEEEYSGDYYVHHDIEVRTVEITIK